MGMNFNTVFAYVVCVQVKIIELLDTCDTERLGINLLLILSFLK